MDNVKTNKSNWDFGNVGIGRCYDSQICLNVCLKSHENNLIYVTGKN